MILTYLSHPEVVIDPGVAVPDWGLSDLGCARVQALALHWPGQVRLISSPERKARQVADILAARNGLAVEIAAESGEVDRSATGYVPHSRHEELADAMFARPAQSADGWERAMDAQARIVAAVAAILAGHRGDDVVMVGHGGVGTLLWCHIAALPIARVHDQPGQGHFWTARIGAKGLEPLQSWQRLEGLHGPG